MATDRGTDLTMPVIPTSTGRVSAWSFATTSLLGDVANVRVVGSEHCYLFAGQLAGNTSHLLTDVVASIAVLKGLHLQFEIGALLAPQSGGARCEAERSMTGCARCYAANWVAGLNQAAHDRPGAKAGPARIRA